MAQAWDLVVVGEELEACLGALAGARLGLRVAQLLRPGRAMGGLVTEGLAYVDRDARHLHRPLRPEAGGQDGLMGSFLAEAEVPLVALRPETGVSTLRRLAEEAGVTCLEGRWLAPAPLPPGSPLRFLPWSGGGDLEAAAFLDGTPDGDLAEACGQPFAVGFQEVGLPGFLGASPLPEIEGLPIDGLDAWAARLEQDPTLEAMRQRLFPGRAFLALERGADYLLIGPPHLGLAYQAWREQEGLQAPWRFEADGFNVAVLGPERSSWNGLMYFSTDPSELLAWSREGACAGMVREAERFVRFVREVGGFTEARLKRPVGMYVRQTRHALGTRERVALGRWGAPREEERVGSFCYYPDFRGFRAVRAPGALTVPILPGVAWSEVVPNLALVSRAAGYTPFAHSIGRLVQAGVGLATAAAAGVALGGATPWRVPPAQLREALARVGALANDPAGFERNGPILAAMAQDEVLAREVGAWA